jgi:Holliday junction resolvase RusA-like endonuclease
VCVYANYNTPLVRILILHAGGRRRPPVHETAMDAWLIHQDKPKAHAKTRTSKCTTTTTTTAALVGDVQGCAPSSNKKITLDLPLRLVSTNSAYATTKRSGRVFCTSKARAFKKSVHSLAVKQCKQGGWKTTDGRVKVHVLLTFPDRRRRDVDNIKLLLDAMEGVIYDDDSQIYELNIKKQIVRNVNHICVTVWQLP